MVGPNGTGKFVSDGAVELTAALTCTRAIERRMAGGDESALGEYGRAVAVEPDGITPRLQVYPGSGYSAYRVERQRRWQRLCWTSRRRRSSVDS